MGFNTSTNPYWGRGAVLNERDRLATEYVEKEFYGTQKGNIGPGHAFKAGWDACQKNHEEDRFLDYIKTFIVQLVDTEVGLKKQKLKLEKLSKALDKIFDEHDAADSDMKSISEVAMKALAEYRDKRN